MRPIDPARPRAVLVAVILLGIGAGLVAAGFLTVTGEPAIEDAIAIEEAAADPTAGGEGELVSRSAQRGIGLFAAYGLSGAAFGLLFGAAFLALGRGPLRAEPFRRAMVAGVALAGAVTVSPWLKYPPNPPAVGDPATLGQRQALYGVLIVLTAVVLFGAAWMSGRLRETGWSQGARVAAVGTAVVVAMLVAYGLLPGAPDPVEVPATLVWRFRLASLGGNLVLWGVLTVGFGLLAGRGGGGGDGSGRAAPPAVARRAVATFPS